MCARRDLVLCVHHHLARPGAQAFLGVFWLLFLVLFLFCFVLFCFCRCVSAISEIGCAYSNNGIVIVCADLTQKIMPIYTGGLRGRISESSFCHLILRVRCQTCFALHLSGIKKHEVFTRRPYQLLNLFNLNKVWVDGVTCGVVHPSQYSSILMN